jgi:hypothetical protein
VAKYLVNSSGAPAESNTVQTSAGASSADKVPSLNASGFLDSSIVNSKATSSGAADAGKLVALDSAGLISSTMVPAIGDSAAFTTSEVIGAGALVNLHNSTGTKARNADASNGREAHGYAPTGAGSGASCTVFLDGLNTVLSGRTPGATQYLAATPGGITETAPATAGQIVQRVGVALSATSARIRPYRPFTLTSGSITSDTVWQPLTVLSVTNPMDFGAAGTGTSNDLTALQAAATALPSTGGIIYLPTGKTFRKDGVWNLTKPVKLWSENRGATIFGRTNGSANLQATRWASVVGVGTFGVRYTSDATVRGAGENANQITWTNCDLCEAEGNEIDGSEALGFCTLGSTNTRVSYNAVHNVLADHYYHSHTGSGGTAVGCANGYLWGNYAYGPPGNSKGDDGISIVTYGETTTRSHDFEIWNNRIFDNQARGLSIVGGFNVNHHNNWAIRCGAAGIYYCSEPSPNFTPTINDVTYAANVSYLSSQTVGHRGIHIAGDNPSAAQPFNIAGTGNWSVGATGGDYIAFNCAASVTSTGLQTTVGSLPAGVTTASTSDLVYQDTTVLRTRDVSYVTNALLRAGLYRIHVRRNGASFQQRFEYVVKGTVTNVNNFCNARAAASDYVSYQVTVGATRYAVLLCAAPVDTAAASVSPVTWTEMRTGDNDGTLSAMWTVLDRGMY